MITNDLSTCKACLSDFPTQDLIWGDKGGQYWICTECYKGESNG
jgi:hypothetical protein